MAVTGYMPHRGRFQRQALPPAAASDLLPEVSASQVRYEEPPEVSRVLVRVELKDLVAVPEGYLTVEDLEVRNIVESQIHLPILPHILKWDDDAGAMRLYSELEPGRHVGQ